MIPLIKIQEKLLWRKNKLRNPDRIPKLLARLMKVWLENPDLRLGQLMSNVWPNMYSPEDEHLIFEIEKFYAKPRIFRNVHNPKDEDEMIEEGEI